jgi:hypothetical protein
MTAEVTEGRVGSCREVEAPSDDALLLASCEESALSLHVALDYQGGDVGRVGVLETPYRGVDFALREPDDDGV